MKDDSKNSTTCQTATLFAVYVIWCRPTDKFYVGVTSKKPYTRIRQHKHGKRQLLDTEIQRIGWDGNFDWWVIEENIPSDKISERECYWIEFFNSTCPNGYNRTCGGITLFKHTEEAKSTMSAVKAGENHPMYGKKHSEETIEKMRQAQLGKHHSDESKEAMRQAHLGKTLTDEHKASISESMTGEKHPFYGKHHSEETKEIMRQKHLGKHHTEETKAQMSADRTGEKHPFYGKKHSEETIEKMRQAHLGNSAHKGKHHSEKTKAILREKALERDVSGEKNPFFGKQHTDEAKEKNRQAHLGRIPWNKGITLSEEAKAQIRAKRAAKEAQMTP